MKHKFSLLILLSCLSLSLVSCNKSLDDPKDFEKKIATYSEEVSQLEFESYNDELKKHKLKNNLRDYVIDEYYYKKETNVTTLDENTKQNRESLETRHYTTKMDYDNILRQDHREEDSNIKVDYLGDEDASSKHLIEDFGYQEIAGSIKLIEKTDKVIRNFPQTTSDFIKNTYPQDSLLVSMLSFDGKYYLDNGNTYTLIETEDNNLKKSEKLKQIVINDDEITYLELHKYTAQNKLIYNEVDTVVEADYRVIKFKDVTLKPIDVTGFKIKGLVD